MKKAVRQQIQLEEALKRDRRRQVITVEGPWQTYTEKDTTFKIEDAWPTTK